MILNSRDKITRYLLSLARTLPLWDGKAVTCCVDYNGVQGVGDVNIQSIREIWNGPELSTIRKNFGKFDYSGFPTCRCCDWVHRR